MTMPSAGTFHYFTVVPACPDEIPSPWPLKLGESSSPRGRLMGDSPALQITDGGAAAGLAPQLEIRRSLFSLTASTRRGAGVRAAAFYIDSAVTRAFEAGDTLHLARTGCGGLGLSLFRKGRLIIALGAVSAVPLGDDVEVSVPHDLVREMEILFRQRDAAFKLRQYPLQIAVGREVRITFGGLTQVGDYNTWLFRGFMPGIPGTNESVAISSRGTSGPGAAPCMRSARWMEEELEMEGWPE